MKFLSRPALFEGDFVNPNRRTFCWYRRSPSSGKRRATRIIGHYTFISIHDSIAAAPLGVVPVILVALRLPDEGIRYLTLEGKI